MTSRRRALLGAAAGAVFVLIVHPATRPGMLAAFRPLPAGGLSRLLARPKLAVPTDLDSGAAYLHAGADRLGAGQILRPEERRTLIAIAEQGEARESDNPFWPLAVFVLHGGKDRVARDAWRRASRCKRYFDHQRPLLLADRDRVAAQVGDVQGWIYAAVAPQRSEAMVLLVRSMAVGTMRSIVSSSEKLDFACEMIRNGALVRDGSERLSLGRVGIAMIEAAPYPPELLAMGKPPSLRPKSPILRLYIAKTTLTANLRKRGQAADAAFCDRQFRTNDSWTAFQSVESPEDRFDALAMASVFAGAMPGGLLAASLAGWLVWLLGRRIDAIAHVSHRFRGSGLTALALTLLACGTALGYPVIGFMAGACVLVPALSPDHPKRFGGSLGPLHVLIVGCMALALGVALVCGAVARSLPGRMLPDLGYYGALVGDVGRWGAVAVVILGGSALAAPAWAFVRRYSTPAIAAQTYRDLGRSMALTGLALAIVMSPLSLALDRWLGNSLAEIALNEQNAYSPRGLEGG